MINPNCKAKIVVPLLVVSLLIGAGLYYYLIKPDDRPKLLGNAVVANGPECARIGINIIRQNGSAIDAAIATLFCEGITCTQSMGLGGGFVATVYHKASGKVETLSARERAPAQATVNMFDNFTGPATGILSVAIPGELKGYWELHQKYGILPWRKLIEPSIALCKNGHIVTEYLAWVLNTFQDVILRTPSLKEVFINPSTNKTWVVGDKLKRPVLAKTLDIFADEGVDALYSYNGTIAKLLISDIEAAGGIITMDDLVNFKVNWNEPTSTQLRDGNTLYSVPLPSSGGVLAFILNIMKDYQPENSITYFHRMIESFKFAYGHRSGLGDPDFEPSVINLIKNITDPAYADMIRAKINDNQTYQDYKYYGGVFGNVPDHGTAQISVLTANGDAITVTSTINTMLGAKLRSPSTGIILNDEMDDFATSHIVNTFGIAPSAVNRIAPGKRPMSSMCPSIILDNNKNVLLLIGAAGGSKITTSTAYSIIRHLYLKEPLATVINGKRFHHQLIPMHLDLENGYDNTTAAAFAKFGHKINLLPPERGFSAVTAISKMSGRIEAVPDARRHGSAEVY